MSLSDLPFGVMRTLQWEEWAEKTGVGVNVLSCRASFLFYIVGHVYYAQGVPSKQSSHSVLPLLSLQGRTSKLDTRRPLFRHRHVPETHAQYNRVQRDRHRPPRYPSGNPMQRLHGERPERSRQARRSELVRRGVRTRGTVDQKGQRDQARGKAGSAFCAFMWMVLRARNAHGNRGLAGGTLMMASETCCSHGAWQIGNWK